jgi:ribose transport system substrate-binding protein
MSQLGPFRVPRRFSAAAMSLLLGLVACKQAKRPMIAVIPETTAQEVWESEHAGAAAAARELGWDIYWNGPSREDDLPRQIQLVNSAIARRVDGLVLAPDHAMALVSPVRAAVAHGIPTVIVSSPLGTSSNQGVMSVLNDDEATGQIAATRAAAYLSPRGAVALIGVNPNLLGSIKEANALESSLRARMPGVTVIERKSTSFSFNDAEETAEETIRSSPALQVMVALNVTQTRAAYAAGLKTNSLGRIKLIGCDQDLDLVFHLRAGEIDALIAQDTRTMGEDAIRMIHEQLAHAQFSRTVVVQPLLITRKNVDSSEVQQVLDMNWRAP